MGPTEALACESKESGETVGEAVGDTIDEKTILGMLSSKYHEHPTPAELDDAAKTLYSMLPSSPATQEALDEFLRRRYAVLDDLFTSLDSDGDDSLDYDDLAVVDHPAKQHLLWCVLDSQQTGKVDRNQFKQQLVLTPFHSEETVLDQAYDFFAQEPQYLQPKYGFGYFWAGGLAGVISRTCTAPFDRLKVYLIASSCQKSIGIGQAIKNIYSQGGIRAFFVGNGLNVIKVFPESAMKFGGFEMAKAFFASIEGVDDPADLSRVATFLAGGTGGMVSQLCVYPLDTLKFRVQCSTNSHGTAHIAPTIRDMWNHGGIRSFYRGLTAGVLGIFPFAALDLGLFALFKSTYIAKKAKAQHIDPCDVQLGNMVVLSMGAISGSIGASVVYPINLVRTRIQTQNTPSHPFQYTGFNDCVRQTYRREGWRGFFRGLGPNLAKVAPSVSISYLVYENAKQLLGLE